MHQSESFI